MEIARDCLALILKHLKPNKVIVIMGARRVGKTKLIENFLKGYPEKSMFLNGDDFDTHKLLENQSIANYRRILGNCKLLVIDEAQEIPDIGKKLKLMVDTIANLKIIHKQ